MIKHGAVMAPYLIYCGVNNMKECNRVNELEIEPWRNEIRALNYLAMKSDMTQIEYEYNRKLIFTKYAIINKENEEWLKHNSISSLRNRIFGDKK